MSEFKQYLDSIKAFKLKAMQLNPKHDTWGRIEAVPPLYNVTRVALGHELYLLTKNCLDNGTNLTAEEKGKILQEYIKTWYESSCRYHLDVLNFGMTPEQSSAVKKIKSSTLPLSVQFNLSGANLKGSYGDKLIFVGVNFNNADLSSTKWPSAHFIDCAFDKVKTSGKTNLSQSVLKDCQVDSNELKRSGNYSGTNFIDCFSRKPYPNFLEKLRIQQRKLTANAVAHAMWLSNEPTKQLHLQFTMWAQENKLSFTPSDVLDSSSTNYVSKK